MANHTTGAQRRNARMDKIFDRAKAEGRGLSGNSHTKGMGVNSPAMMQARKGLGKKYDKGIHKIGSNPSRFLHKGGKGDIDLYETWKGGKQSIKPTNSKSRALNKLKK
jgi:hypothetical protein